MNSIISKEFTAIDEKDLVEINGGIAPVVAYVAGVVTSLVIGDAVNGFVKGATGRTLSDWAQYYGQKAGQAVKNFIFQPAY